MRLCARFAWEKVPWNGVAHQNSTPYARPLTNHAVKASARGFATRPPRLVRFNIVTVALLSLLGHYHSVLPAVSISRAGAIEQLKGAWKRLDPFRPPCAKVDSVYCVALPPLSAHDGLKHLCSGEAGSERHTVRARANLLPSGPRERVAGALCRRLCREESHRWRLCVGMVSTAQRSKHLVSPTAKESRGLTLPMGNSGDP